MKTLLNIIESILLTIAVFLVVMCMTLLNKRYVKFILSNNNYYQTVVNKMDEDITVNHYIDSNKVKNDINNYIDNYYEDKEYNNKIILKNDNPYLTSYYNEQIKFIGPFTNYRLKKDIIDFSTLFIVIIIGLVFMKTKFKHNISLIIFISGVLGILISFLFLFNQYEGILSKLIKGSYYIYLGTNIFLIIYSIALKVYKWYVNRRKI